MKGSNFAVIIAGGKGERLWPLSTSKNPKPFLRIFEDTLIQKTHQRLLKLFDKDKIFFIVPENLKSKIKEFIPSANVITEPIGKNTAPACIYATHFIKKIDATGTVGIFPADHIIKKEEEFLKAVRRGFEVAKKGFIITFGIKPTRPETGYGYVEIDKKIDKKKPDVYRVKKFHEKPDFEFAKRYLRSGRYFWNSGMFIWNAEFFFEELKRTREEIYTIYEKTLMLKDSVSRFYDKIESNSIDYALLEYSKNIACCVSKFVWEDLGSFLSFENVFDKDREGNVKKGKVFLFESRGNIVISEDKIIAGKNIENLVIVAKDDVVLIISKEKSQEVKKLLKELKKYLPEKYF